VPVTPTEGVGTIDQLEPSQCAVIARISGV
jgi:hypothetical protein